MKSDYRVFVDTEYVYPGMRKNTPRPTAADKRQIVQIAAIRWNTSKGEEVDNFNVLVKPTYEKLLPEFFIELTDITQKDVDAEGYPFSEALRQFADFCRDIPIWTFDKDEEVFRQNCSYINIHFPFTRPFTRVKPLLSQWGISDDYSSGTLYKAAGLQMNGHVHNALHDVRSMAAAVHHFEAKQN